MCIKAIRKAGPQIWHYSCPECGAEYEFETYGELQDYLAKHEGFAPRQCEACVQDGAPVIYVSDAE